jgi:hypothetical protein
VVVNVPYRREEEIEHHVTAEQTPKDESSTSDSDS